MVRPLAARQRLQHQRLFAIEGALGQEQQAIVARPRDIDLAQQHLAQRQGVTVESHHFLAAGAEAIEHGLHEQRILAREDTEAVARLVGDTRSREIEHDMAHVFFRAAAVERMGIDKGGERRTVA